jgi:hypothetical protein
MNTRRKILFILLILAGNVSIINSQILINEFLASNINGLIDIESGEFSDWIELYNSADTTFELTDCFLTDDPNNSMLWQFPTGTRINANSYLLVWLDDKNYGFHTNFKLDSDGEQIILFSSNLSIIDSVTFGKQRDDVSYGRSLNDKNVWLFYSENTPGKENKSLGIKKNKRSADPLFSHPDGFYQSSFNLDFSLEDSTEIYYTTDGSIPYLSLAIKYDSPIFVDSTTVIRAISVEKGLLPSEIITKTFFINDQSDLPVISITTDPKNLWDDKIGIYAVGTNGLSYWNVKANYWQDWERPINIAYYEANKVKGFELNAGLAVSGARRNMMQKSLRIETNGKYGQKSIDYKIFDDKEIRTFSSLILRNGGYPDFQSTLLRDGFMHQLVGQEMNLEYQSNKPSILYVNGNYWGIYNIREKQNEEYLKFNSGIDPEYVDIIENDTIVIAGDYTHYQNLVDFINRNNLADNQNYELVKQSIDIDNFMNYQIAQIYFANVDWPGNNIKYWRPRTDDGKWRWILFDVDAGFGLWGNYDFNSILLATAENSKEWNNPPWSTFLLRNLLKNKDFEEEFIQKSAAYLSYTFRPEEVVSKINSAQEKIELEFQKHINRWALQCDPDIPENKDGCLFTDINEWYSNVEIMRQFAYKRPQFIRQHLMDYFSLADTIKLYLNSNNNAAGNVYINGVRSSYENNATLFIGKKIAIEAIPKSGFRFVGWEGSFESRESLLELIPNSNIELTALFEPDNYNFIPFVISGDYELSIENSPYTSDGDIYVYENATLIINPGVEIKMPKDAGFYIYGGLELRGTKEKPITIKPLESDKNWGSINFVNAKRKSKINYARITGTTRGKDLVDMIGGISSYNSDVEANYLVLDSLQFPIFVQYGNFLLRNSTVNTDITSDGINAKYGNVLVEGCEFIGNLSPDTDAIDYDDVKNGIIRRNVIHDFIGENSDGIDIGEGANNILIEENLIFNCSDKGISIGQKSTANVKGNIITNCNLGIGIKDALSYAFVDHNTFYQNNTAVACFEKTIGLGGGKADIVNTIFSSSFISDIFADEFSEIRVNYSLSDKGELIGTGNILDYPQFLNPELKDFRLAENSPAINSGDPEYAADPDGSRTNMGASYYDYYQQNRIIITEINYHSNTNFDSKDWVEFYNPNPTEVDLTNWIFKDENDSHIYNFEKDAIVSPGDYFVLCEDTSSFKKLYPNVKNYIGNFNFGLNNSGEKIRLFDNYGNIVDSLSYDDDLPWPVAADGEGYTLQLINYDLENYNYENWESTLLHGSPGEQNIIVQVSQGENIIPAQFELFQNYPNPFNPSTTIGYSLPFGNSEFSVQLDLYDILGRKVETLVSEKQKSGRYQVIWNAFKYSSGVYFYKISINSIGKGIRTSFSKVNKLILLK